MVKTNNKKSAGRELTSKNKSASQSSQLTRRLERPFVVCFSRKLENNYKLSGLKERNIKELHTFFEKAIGLPVKQVDDLFLRNPDKEDKLDSIQIQHYEVTKTFRIHGFYADEHFHLVRLDPKHDVHKV